MAMPITTTATTAAISAVLPRLRAGSAGGDAGGSGTNGRGRGERVARDQGTGRGSRLVERRAPPGGAGTAAEASGCRPAGSPGPRRPEAASACRNRGYGSPSPGRVARSLRRCRGVGDRFEGRRGHLWDQLRLGRRGLRDGRGQGGLDGRFGGGGAGDGPASAARAVGGVAPGAGARSGRGRGPLRAAAARPRRPRLDGPGWRGRGDAVWSRGRRPARGTRSDPGRTDPLRVTAAGLPAPGGLVRRDSEPSDVDGAPHRGRPGRPRPAARRRCRRALRGGRSSPRGRDQTGSPVAAGQWVVRPDLHARGGGGEGRRRLPRRGSGHDRRGGQRRVVQRNGCRGGVEDSPPVDAPGHDGPEGSAGAGGPGHPGEERLREGAGGAHVGGLDSVRRRAGPCRAGGILRHRGAGPCTGGTLRRGSRTMPRRGVSGAPGSRAAARAVGSRARPREARTMAGGLGLGEPVVGGAVVAGNRPRLGRPGRGLRPCRGVVGLFVTCEIGPWHVRRRLTETRRWRRRCGRTVGFTFVLGPGFLATHVSQPSDSQRSSCVYGRSRPYRPPVL